MPIEGEQAAVPTAGQMLRDDVVTCSLKDPVGEVKKRIADSRYGFALVTGADNVLLGRLRRSALDCDPDLRVEEVMEEGPSTTRPDKPASELASRLAERELRYAVITTPEGRLLGVACREDLERA